METRRVMRAFAVPLFLCGIFASQASAQQPVTPGVGLGLNVGYHTASGDDFEGVDPGLGVEGVVRYILLNGVGLGVFGGMSSHNVDGHSEDASFLALGAEVRYAFPAIHPTAQPFIAAQAGYRKWSVDFREGGVQVTAEASGFSGSGIAGVQFPVAPQIAVDVAARAMFMSFGDASAAGFTASDTSTNGFSVGLQAGIHFVLGQ